MCIPRAQSEELLGQALKSTGIAPHPMSVVATKAYGIMGPGPNDRGRLARAICLDACGRQPEEIAKPTISTSIRFTAFDPVNADRGDLGARLDYLVHSAAWCAIYRLLQLGPPGSS